MIYNIQFIRRVAGKTDAPAIEVMSLVGDQIAAVIEQASELYHKLDTVPRPDGFRILDSDGEILHEYYDIQNP